MRHHAPHLLREQLLVRRDPRVLLRDRRASPGQHSTLGLAQCADREPLSGVAVGESVIK